jgi:diguanylate cyclase (GGDEF)-like protein
MALLRHRYLLGFLAAALILGLVGAGILLATGNFREDSRSVAHTLEVIATVDRAHADLLRGIEGQRTYLLSGDAESRRLFQQTRARARAHLVQLGALVRGNPDQARRAALLADLFEQRLDSAQEALRLFEQEGLGAAQAYIRGNRGIILSRRIDALAADLRAAAQALLQQRKARADRSANLLLGAGAIGIPLSLAILIAIYLLLSREVRERAHAESRAQALNQDLERSVGGLERASADLGSLSRYTGLLQSCRTVEEAVHVSRRALARLLPEIAGTVYLQRASQDYFEAHGGWGTHAADSQVMLTPQDCWALRRGQPHSVINVQDGMRCMHVTPPADEAATTTACLPLAAHNLNLGFLYLSAPGVGPLPNFDIAVAAAEQLSLALGNLHLQESLRQQSIRDALTGLYNRRYLEASLPREIARCERRAIPLSVLMLDLDHFKAFNDEHGHEGGDALLSAFGQVLLAHSRDEDIPCRYGGEEFTLILSEMDLDAARQRAEQIRAAVETLRIRHFGREIGGATLSVGLAMYPLHADTPSALLRIADEALYRAKRNGRNRIEIAKPTTAAS